MKDEPVSAVTWISSDEFHTRLRVYFYVAAVIVAGQLIWMIEHSVMVLDNCAMETINKKTPLEMGFTSEQAEKSSSIALIVN